MKRLLAFAGIGTLLACGSADSPFAPSPEPSDIVAGAVAGAGTAYFTGRGVAVDATVLDVNTKLCDTGAMPSEGARIERIMAAASIPSVVSSTKAYCITTNVGSYKGISEATLWGLNLTIAGNVIAADHLHSMSGAWCPPDDVPTHAGSAFTTNLRVNGRLIAIKRNTRDQKVDLPNGYLVFNEHRSFQSPWHAGRTVTGLRVVINSDDARSEIVLARSQMHIDCP